MPSKRLLVFAAAAILATAYATQAQGQRKLPVRRVTQPLREASLDLGTGRYTIGPGVTKKDAAPFGTEVSLTNLDLSGFVGVDTVNSEWYDHAAKGTGRSGGKSEIMTAFTFAYCSSALTTSSGGVGGSVAISFREDYTGPLGGLGSAPSGSLLATYNLSGLPANSTLSSFFGGFTCYTMTVDTATQSPSGGFSGGQALPDGDLGWSWNFVDGSPGPLAHTTPFLACVQTCNGAGPDGQGMTDGFDRYFPKDSFSKIFTFSSATTYSSIAIEIREARAIASSSVNYNPQLNRTGISSVVPPVLGETWVVTVDCAGASPGERAWAILDVSPPRGWLKSNFGWAYFSGSVLTLKEPHGGGVARFKRRLPLDLNFYNLSYRVQGFCEGVPFSRSWLTDALDERVGSY